MGKKHDSNEMEEISISLPSKPLELLNIFQKCFESCSDLFELRLAFQKFVILEKTVNELFKTKNLNDIKQIVACLGKISTSSEENLKMVRICGISSVYFYDFLALSEVQASNLLKIDILCLIAILDNISKYGLKQIFKSLNIDYSSEIMQTFKVNPSFGQVLPTQEYHDLELLKAKLIDEFDCKMYPPITADTKFCKLHNVESTRENYNSLLTALKSEKPILLRGTSSSGKSSLFHEYLAKSKQNLVEIQLTEDTDISVLLGSYICKSTINKKGEEQNKFVYEYGSLIKAMIHGHIVLVEDIHLASYPVLLSFVSLFKYRKLYIPSKQESIAAHVDFKFFATFTDQGLTSPSGEKYNFYQKNFSTVICQSLSKTEITSIIFEKYSNLHELVKKNVLNTYHEICLYQNQDESQVNFRRNMFSIRNLSLKELFRVFDSLSKLSKRMRFLLKTNNSTLSETNILKIIKILYDYWLGYNLTVNEEYFIVLSKSWNISPEILNTYLSSSSSFSSNLDSGSISTSSPFTSGSENFALTSVSEKLLTRVSVSLNNKEPILLVGETGTGKTESIQYLSKLEKKKLIIINCHYQTEESDLIGNYKPFKLDNVAHKLFKETINIFLSYFEKEKNLTFLKVLKKTIVKKDYQKLVKICSKVVSSISNKISKIDDKNEGRRKRIKLDHEENKSRDVESLEKYVTEVEFFKSVIVYAENGSQVPLMFQFEVGPLIEAIENGDWILLDEINLCNHDVLQRLIPILRDQNSSITITERGDMKPIHRHQDFRLFGCMNPANDVGKQSLLPTFRSYFTEYFVEETSSRQDILLVVEQILKQTTISTDFYHQIVEFYLKVKSMEREKDRRLVDMSENLVKFSLRTLCRSLNTLKELFKQKFSLAKSTYIAFDLHFLKKLSFSASKILKNILFETLFKSSNLNNLQKQLDHPISCPDRKNKADYTLIENVWLKKRETLSKEMDIEVNNTSEEITFISTESFRDKLRNLAQLILINRYPVLLQGPTSTGKTTLVRYLGQLLNQKVLRINNHENTDISDYIGNYVNTEAGTFVFEKGPLIEAMENGYWIILDELNLCSTEILESLNRVLDDNRELYVSQLDYTVTPHENFMIFATQNPVKGYGGRKQLSKALKNRFVELNFDTLKDEELKIIIHEKSKIGNKFCEVMINIKKELELRRSEDHIFRGKNSLITIRDMLKWANRFQTEVDKAFEKKNSDKNFDYMKTLALEGFYLLGERSRNEREKKLIKDTINKYCKTSIAPDDVYNLLDSSLFQEDSIVWTESMKRMFFLLRKGLANKEPVLLIGETGLGKTTVCQTLANTLSLSLTTVNCHQNSEASDFLGNLRPIRQKNTQESTDLVINKKLFEWEDGPLVLSLKSGGIFLLDEISLADDSVLERLNSLLERNGKLYLIERPNKNDRIVSQHENFSFVATMNPGGDYGKKELSPALLNRFTEIWIPNELKTDDIFAIMLNHLQKTCQFDADILQNFVHSTLTFVQKFKAQSLLTGNFVPITYSIRDYITAVQFLVQLLNKFDKNDSYSKGTLQKMLFHAVDFCFIQGIGIGSSFSFDSFQKQRELATTILFSILRHGDNAFLSESDLTEQVNYFDINGLQYYGSKLFCVRIKEKAKSVANDFYPDSTTVQKNMLFLLRAMTLQRGIMLEGVPGVGKTALVEGLGSFCGVKVVRINLSEQTDFADLVGLDVPVGSTQYGTSDSEDQSKVRFKWEDGVLLKAIKEGHWVLLDELNLANQTVLEGLNSLLDHRQSIFIPELNQLYKVHADFRLFATQNPVSQGNGRKGLSKAFLNRFSRLHLSPMKDEDLVHILKNMFPVLYSKYRNLFECSFVFLKSVKELNPSMTLNLRDLIRFFKFVQQDFNQHEGNSQSEVTISLSDHVKVCFIIRLESIDDQTAAKALYFRDFKAFEENENFTFKFKDNRFEHSWLSDKMTNKNFFCVESLSEQRLTHSSLSREYYDELWCLSLAIKQCKPIIYCVSPEQKIGSELVQRLALERNIKIHILYSSLETDLVDLLGCFEQYDQLNEIKRIWCSLLTFLEGKYDTEEFFGPYVLECIQKLKNSLRTLSLVDLNSLPAMKTMLKKVEILKTIFDKEQLESFVEKTLKQLQTLEAEGDQVRFIWKEGALVKAVREGYWFVIENCFLIGADVLDRLNSLFENKRVLYVQENGQEKTLIPHKNFRIILLTETTKLHSISRAMRNRCIIINGKSQTSDINIPSLELRLRSLQHEHICAKWTMRLVNEPVVNCFVADVKTLDLCVRPLLQHRPNSILSKFYCHVYCILFLHLSDTKLKLNEKIALRPNEIKINLLQHRYDLFKLRIKEESYFKSRSVLIKYFLVAYPWLNISFKNADQLEPNFLRDIRLLTHFVTIFLNKNAGSNLEIKSFDKNYTHLINLSASFRYLSEALEEVLVHKTELEQNFFVFILCSLIFDIVKAAMPNSLAAVSDDMENRNNEIVLKNKIFFDYTTKNQIQQLFAVFELLSHNLMEGALVEEIESLFEFQAAVPLQDFEKYKNRFNDSRKFVYQSSVAISLLPHTNDTHILKKEPSLDLKPFKINMSLEIYLNLLLSSRYMNKKLLSMAIGNVVFPKFENLLHDSFLFLPLSLHFSNVTFNLQENSSVPLFKIFQTTSNIYNYLFQKRTRSLNEKASIEEIEYFVHIDKESNKALIERDASLASYKSYQISEEIRFLMSLFPSNEFVIHKNISHVVRDISLTINKTINSSKDRKFNDSVSYHLKEAMECKEGNVGEAVFNLAWALFYQCIPDILDSYSFIYQKMHFQNYVEAFNATLHKAEKTWFSYHDSYPLSGESAEFLSTNGSLNEFESNFNSSKCGCLSFHSAYQKLRNRILKLKESLNSLNQDLTRNKGSKESRKFKLVHYHTVLKDQLSFWLDFYMLKKKYSMRLDIALPIIVCLQLFLISFELMLRNHEEAEITAKKVEKQEKASFSLELKDFMNLKKIESEFFARDNFTALFNISEKFIESDTADNTEELNEDELFDRMFPNFRTSFERKLEDVEFDDLQVNDENGSLDHKTLTSKSKGNMTKEFLLCFDFASDASKSQISKVNVYKDTILEECQKLTVLSELKPLLDDILKTQEENESLKRLIAVVDHMLQLKVSLPLMKFVIGLEILLNLLDSFLSTLPSFLSSKFTTVFSKLCQILAQYRKLELESYQSLFRESKIELETKEVLLFFDLYKVVKADNVSINAVINIISKFIRSSTLATFTPRLKVLQVLAKLLLSKLSDTEQNIARDVKVGYVIRNMYLYYMQFDELISREKDSRAAAVEKGVEDFIKKCKWDTRNRYSLKESAHKSHRKLFQFILNYKKVLNLPIAGFLERHLDNFIKNISLVKPVVKVSDILEYPVSCLSEFLFLQDTNLRVSVTEKLKYADRINNLICSRLKNLQRENIRKENKMRSLSNLFRLLKSEGLNVSSKISLNLNLDLFFSEALEIGELEDNKSSVELYLKVLSQFKQFEGEVHMNSRENEFNEFDKTRARESLTINKSLLVMSLLLRKDLLKFFEMCNKIKSQTELLDLNRVTVKKEILLSEISNSFIALTYNELEQINSYFKSYLVFFAKLEVKRNELSKAVSEENRFSNLKQIIVSSPKQSSDGLYDYLNKPKRFLNTVDKKLNDSSVIVIKDVRQKVCNRLLYINQLLTYLKTVQGDSVLVSCTKIAELKQSINSLGHSLDNESGVQFEGLPFGYSSPDTIEFLLGVAESTESMSKLLSKKIESDSCVQRSIKQSKLHQEKLVSFISQFISSKQEVIKSFKESNNLFEIFSTVRKILQTKNLVKLHDLFSECLYYSDKSKDKITTLLKFVEFISSLTMQVMNGMEKLNYLLLRIFRVLWHNGVCSPPEDEEETPNGNGCDDNLQEGTGFGDGVGENDVSNEIESEEQLLGLQEDEELKAKDDDIDDDVKPPEEEKGTKDNNESEERDDEEAEFENQKDFIDENSNETSAGDDEGIEMGNDFDAGLDSLAKEDSDKEKEDENELDDLMEAFDDLQSDEESIIDEKQATEEDKDDKLDDKFDKDRGTGEEIESDLEAVSDDEQVENPEKLEADKKSREELSLEEDENLEEESEALNDQKIEEFHDHTKQEEEFKEEEDNVDDDESEIRSTEENEEEQEEDTLKDTTSVEDETEKLLADDDEVASVHSSSDVERDEDEQIPNNAEYEGDIDMADANDIGNEKNELNEMKLEENHEQEENVEESLETEQKNQEGDSFKEGVGESKERGAEKSSSDNPWRQRGSAIENFFRNLKIEHNQREEKQNKSESVGQINKENQVQSNQEFEFIKENDTNNGVNALAETEKDDTDTVLPKNMEEQELSIEENRNQLETLEDPLKNNNENKKNVEEKLESASKTTKKDTVLQEDQMEIEQADTQSNDKDTELHELNSKQNDANHDIELDKSLLTVNDEELRHAESEVVYRSADSNSYSYAELEAFWNTSHRNLENSATVFSEELRMLLTNNLKSRYQGDYKKGKKLNIKKLITFIASKYKKDKIWLKKNKKNKKEYQIMLLVDNSKSMNKIYFTCLEIIILFKLAFSKISTLTTLPSNNSYFSLLTFGENIKTIVSFNQMNSSVNMASLTAAESSKKVEGVGLKERVLKNLDFNENKTNLLKGLKELETIFMNEKYSFKSSSDSSSQASGSSKYRQICFILSDGKFDNMSRSQIKIKLDELLKENIFVVLIMIESNKKSESLLESKKVEYTADGEIVIKQYLADYPFTYYVIINQRDIHLLPKILSNSLKQWFQLDVNF